MTNNNVPEGKTKCESCAFTPCKHNKTKRVDVRTIKVFLCGDVEEKGEDHGKK